MNFEYNFVFTHGECCDVYKKKVYLNDVFFECGSVYSPSNSQQADNNLD